MNNINNQKSDSLEIKGRNFFTILTVIFLAILLTGGIFYLAVQNKKQTPAKYLIINGSLFKNLPDGQKELIVDKDELKHEQLETIEIESFQLSPDKTKILLFTIGDISAYILYHKDIATKKITFVDFGEEALWSPNNRYIAFTRRPADVGPLYLYVFDTLLNENIEIIHTKDKIHTSYKQLGWSSASDAVTAQYETRDDIPYGYIIDKGETKIMLKL